MDDITQRRIEEIIATAPPEMAASMRQIVNAALQAQDDRARLACQNAPTLRQCAEFERCNFARDPNVCPLRAYRAKIARVRQRLTDARACRRERNLVLDHVRDVQRLRPTAALAAVREWVRAPLPLLVLSGPVGVGKTLAATYALARFRGLYTTGYKFSRPAPDGVHLADAIEPHLLVIDQADFDAAGVPPFAAQQMREVIDARYAEQRLTILCCNMSRDDFALTFGGTMADRLDGDGRWVTLEGKSMRQAEASA